MVPINEFIATKKPKKPVGYDLNVYKRTYNNRTTKHFILINGLEEWKRLCQNCSYMDKIQPGIITNYENYIRREDKMLIQPSRHFQDGSPLLSWDTYNKDTQRKFEFVTTIHYNDFNLEYWEKNDWPTN